MKIATFNLRTDVPGDGENRWQCRKGLVLDRLMAEQPDVVGFQEATPEMAGFLRRYMPVSYTHLQFVLRYDAIRQRAAEHERAAQERRNAIEQAQARCDAAKAARAELDARQAEAEAREKKIGDPKQVKQMLKDILIDMMKDTDLRFPSPTVLMVIGVNRCV